MVREESLLSIRKIMYQCLVALSAGLKEGGIDQSSWISLQEITGPTNRLFRFLARLCAADDATAAAAAGST